MIQIANIVRHTGIDFQEYLDTKGYYSHSFLKNEINGISEDFKATPAMQLGTLVDNILTEPLSADMHHELYPYAKEIATELNKIYGAYLHLFEKQVHYTAELSYSGFTMPVKGRLDIEIPKVIVTDFKVLQTKDARTMIDFMGYNNQLWLYSKMSGVKEAFIFAYLKPLKKVQTIRIDTSSDYNPFWADKILKFGKIINNENLTI